MLWPSALQLSACTEPNSPKRTRASPSSKSPVPRSSTSVPPAVGAPCGRTLEMATSKPGWPKMAKVWLSAVLAAASPLIVSSSTCRRSHGVQISTAGALQRASLGPRMVAGISSSGTAWQSRASGPQSSATCSRSSMCRGIGTLGSTTPGLRGYLRVQRRTVVKLWPRLVPRACPQLPIGP
eukprot:scaffold10109_cov57-Phaeocystis_antarctica.AAC.2